MTLQMCSRPTMQRQGLTRIEMCIMIYPGAHPGQVCVYIYVCTVCMYVCIAPDFLNLQAATSRLPTYGFLCFLFCFFIGGDTRQLVIAPFPLSVNQV